MDTWITVVNFMIIIFLVDCIFKGHSLLVISKVEAIRTFVNKCMIEYFFISLKWRKVGEYFKMNEFDSDITSCN